MDFLKRKKKKKVSSKTAFSKNEMCEESSPSYRRIVNCDLEEEEADD